MGSLEETYNRLGTYLADQQMADLTESIAHVREVEQLRQLYKLPADVRFLLLAESHVRTSDSDYQRKGIQFIYEHRYYTPWWQSLILPGFGAQLEKYKGTPNKAESRRKYLDQLRRSGFWLLDVSIMALSGYKNVGQVSSRPFVGKTLRGITELSWEGHVRSLFEQAMNQSTPPVIVAFTNVAHVLPPMLQSSVHQVKFLVSSNSRAYANAAYPYGTHAFAAAACEAGLQACLSDL